MIVPQRSHPVFNQNINLGIWQKSLDRGQRGGCENSIANGSKSNQQDLAHFLPIPTSWPKRPRRIFTLQGVHCFRFYSTELRRRSNDVAQAVHPKSHFNGGFVDKYNENVVANRVDAFTLDTHQPVRIRLQLYLGL